MHTLTKFEEEKQCDEERSLAASLKTFKTIQYVFEVDGQQMINSDDSLGNCSSLLQKKYQEINEKNIQDSMARMMDPLSMHLNAPKKLNENSLKMFPGSLEIGSMRSESTCMASDMESISSARNSFSSDHHHEEEPQPLPTPPMPQNKWQRKHNRFVLGALQLQKQYQQESSYYYPGSSIIQP